MPTYVWECPVCKIPMEVVCPMEERNRPMFCTGPHKAQYLCTRVVTPVAGIVRNPAVPRRG